MIGQTAGFTGAVAAGVKETSDGAKLYIDMVNAEGGMNGQKIELVSLDDKFDPKLAAENARKLIEEKNVSRHVPEPRHAAYRGHHSRCWTKHGVPLIGPSTGAMVLHNPVQQACLQRAGHLPARSREGDRPTSLPWASPASPSCMADDSFGADGLAGAQKGFAAAQSQGRRAEKFNRSKPDFSADRRRLIVKADVQAVMMIASGQAVVDGHEGIPRRRVRRRRS